MLLFDLGGVLVDFTGVRDIAALLSKPASRADIVERWSHCPVSYAFGVGEIGPAEFAQRFVRDWGITLEPEQFLREFRSWSRGFLPGARELLDTLRPRFRLGAVSNSNEVHWARNAELGVTQQFEFAVSSHQVGACKPDAAVYEAALIVENDLHRGLDGLIVVTAPEAVQLARLRLRDGMSEAEARARLAAQLPAAEKKRQATVVIENSGSEEALAAQVERLLAQMR